MPRAGAAAGRLVALEFSGWSEGVSPVDGPLWADWRPVPSLRCHGWVSGSVWAKTAVSAVLLRCPGCPGILPLQRPYTPCSLTNPFSVFIYFRIFL